MNKADRPPAHIAHPHLNSRPSHEELSCLEVWGGNDSTERNIAVPGLDAWVFSAVYGRAARGGDVYYVSSCATGRITRLLVADVSGHGREVAAPAETLRTLMRRFINQLDQTRFVRAMNSAFAALSRNGLFATAVVATYFAPTLTLTITNAGHPPPLLYDATARQWRLLEMGVHNVDKPTDIPLGVLPVSDYRQHARRLHENDMALFYTDSLIECRDANGKLIGCDGLKHALNQLDTHHPDGLIRALLTSLRTLHEHNLDDDDTTILLVTPNSSFEFSAGVATLKHHLAAMAKLVQALLSRDQPIPWPDLHPANIGGAIFKPLNKLWGRHLQD